MKSIITAIVTCCILFGASFAASNYFAEQAEDPNAEVEGGETGEETPPEGSLLPPDPDQIDQVSDMQVANLSDESVSLEAVLQMSDSIRKMEEQLAVRERKVRQSEARVKALFTDLENEQEELKSFSDGVDAKVRALERMSEQLRQAMLTMDSRKAELKLMEKRAGVDPESKEKEISQKVDGVKSWFAKLEAEQAAVYLKDFANKGKLEMAAALLNKMPDSQKSKILGALNDPVLVGQMIEALKVKPKLEN